MSRVENDTLFFLGKKMVLKSRPFHQSIGYTFVKKQDKRAMPVLSDTSRDKA